MPPSAQRRVKGRKQVEVAERSDIEEDVVGQTPSRKKRKGNNHESLDAGAPDNRHAGASTAHRSNRSSDIQVFEDETSFTEEDEINAVINNLRRAKYDIQASIDHSNDVLQAQHPEGKQAYAKIAGNGWTFYVEELEVRIGRPPDERRGDAGETGSETNQYDKSLVHIDLGPSKLVSRQHAEIRYDESSRGWLITVNGRNGVRLDFEPLARGQTAPLHSGTVIEIADTQMIFITPNERPRLHPKIISQTRSSLEEDDDERDQMKFLQPPTNERQTPMRGSESRSTHNGAGKAPYSSRDQRSHADHRASTDIVDESTDTRIRSSSLKHKTSPYQRGLMLESTEDIDYSLDSAKDLKPPHSYAQLIGMAIMSSDEEKLTLSKIYEWIKDHYAFYRHSGGGWQNSIRHNLSLNKSFEKVARRTDEPGKGMKWQIVPEHRDEVLKRAVAQPRNKGRSSGPNSPLKDTDSSLGARQGSHRQDERVDDSRASPTSTPPVARYPSAKHAFTPDRGGNYLHHLEAHAVSSPQPGLEPSAISPFPYSVRAYNKQRVFTETANAGSPGGPAMLFNSDSDNPLMTPFVRNAPRLAPPSTAHLPSHFMPMSSPAPFWKYADLYGTPGRPLGPAPYHALDISPEKKRKLDDEDAKEDTSRAETERTTAVTGIRSSSPPVLEGDVGQESPTKAISMRNGEKSSNLAAPYQTAHRTSPSTTNASHAMVDHIPVKQSHKPREHISFDRTHAAFQPLTKQDEDSEEEGDLIDLAKGFQTIGSFHRGIGAAGPPKFAA